MIARLFPSIPQSITVFVFWLLMAEDASAGNLLMAALLAVLMPQLAARLEREFARLGEVWLLVPLGLTLLWDIVVANVTVARQVLGPESKLHPGFIWIPLELTNIHGISALTSVITLTPGTLTAELSEDRTHLLVHCLDVKDPQAMVDEIKRRYEAPLRRIFP
ncbi:multicomponent K+:H+ antiporter subunit E [Luteimonas sp. J16]|jgi:multicomponent K+:H+ antiporter subunit E|uniref:Na+/H+ antiporter subunit E n=1 Tax=unclassified Luteimonas TaxID=2629088 RepID=UPI000479AB9D|nr:MULTISPECIES: Na+/H+ antiporter subunit E [unclassified Luteimonas]TWG91951.1 multicomponent K+:H+ antiporter subunit E [Luteimonas sp. J16]